MRTRDTDGLPLLREGILELAARPYGQDVTHL